MKKILLIAAALLTLLCAFNLYWWISNAINFDSFNETLTNYLSIFPSSLQDGRLLSNLSLLVLTLTIGALIYLISQGYKLFLSISVLIPAAFMFMWTLFSLM